MFYRYYDAIFAGKDYAAEVRCVLTLAGIHERGARILEIGSGTGNHTLACVESGHRVVGVEIDAQMCDVAERKRARLPADAASKMRFFHGRVEDLPDDGFDLAIALFNVVNYLASLDDLHAFLEAIARKIRPGAPFVFDAWNGVAAVLDPPRNKESRIETRTHEIRVVLESQTDFMALQTILRYAIEARPKAGGDTEHGTYCMVQTLWPAKVLADAAARAGFEVVGIHPLDDHRRGATRTDWKLVFHCRGKA